MATDVDDDRTVGELFGYPNPDHVITKVSDVIGLSPSAVNNAEKLFNLLYANQGKMNFDSLNEFTLDKNATLASSLRALTIASNYVASDSAPAITAKYSDNMRKAFGKMRQELNDARNALHEEPGASSTGQDLWLEAEKVGRKTGFTDRIKPSNPAKFIVG